MIPIERDEFGNIINADELEFEDEPLADWERELLEQEWDHYDTEDDDDHQPTEYEEWQDVYDGDDWDHGQFDSDLGNEF